MAENEAQEQRKTSRIVSFYHEVKSEMRKVTWPTRTELYGATIVVFVVTVVLSAALGFVDAVFTHILEFIYSV
mgnify:CR=1 FL=1